MSGILPIYLYIEIKDLTTKCRKKLLVLTGLILGILLTPIAVDASGDNNINVAGLSLDIMLVTTIAIVIILLSLIFFAYFNLKKSKVAKLQKKTVPPNKIPSEIKPSKEGVPTIGEIVVNKTREGNKIRIRVNNSSDEDIKDCILVDGITRSADIQFVIGKNVNRKRNHLIWNIENLKAGDKTVLEYTTSSDKRSRLEKFSFLSKRPVMARVTES